ncbi:hypothetical protein ACIOUE_00905 [Streptomyces xanthochromogenes]|uniref:hypothetical protein n=1 Tax=Streptomyces xanthochromogenes TaxID=67384 RepID=UPI0037F44C7F
MPFRQLGERGRETRRPYGHSNGITTSGSCGDRPDTHPEPAKIRRRPGVKAS